MDISGNGQIFRQIEAIIFDKDGTLADSRHFLTVLAQARAQELNHHWPGIEAELLKRFGIQQGRLDPDSLMAVGSRAENQSEVIQVLVQQGIDPEIAASQVDDCFQSVDQILTPQKAQHTPPFVGTRAMLARLAKSSIKLGVLSSDSSTNVEQFLQHYGLDQFFQGWLGTEGSARPKPDPMLLWQLCEILQVGVSHSLVLGDSLVDQQLALRAGAAGFISVSEWWGRTPIAGADAVVTTWDDLEVINR